MAMEIVSKVYVAAFLAIKDTTVKKLTVWILLAQSMELVPMACASAAKAGKVQTAVNPILTLHVACLIAQSMATLMSICSAVSVMIDGLVQIVLKNDVIWIVAPMDVAKGVCAFVILGGQAPSAMRNSVILDVWSMDSV